MVSKNGKSGYRSFTLVGASKSSGCKTKGYGGRFINKTAAGAALKAFTELCRTKRIKGICTLYITIKDTTKNGKHRGKMYVYRAQRNRLNKPMIRLEGTDNEFVIEYRSVAKSIKSRETTDCGKKFPDVKQSRGRYMRRTARKTRITANNVRQMRTNKRNVTPTRKSGRVLELQKKERQTKLRRSKRIMKQKVNPLFRVFNQTD
jgi:hypothetical protein